MAQPSNKLTRPFPQDPPSSASSAPKPQPNRLRKSPDIASTSAVSDSDQASLPDDDNNQRQLLQPPSKMLTKKDTRPQTLPSLGALPPPPLQSFSKRPEPTRQTSYSKRHASFDTPREMPLPFGPHDGFPLPPTYRERSADSIETTKPTHSKQNSTTSPSSSSAPPLNRNNSAPTPPATASPGRASTDVQDLKGTHGGTSSYPSRPQMDGSSSSDESISRRSTASLPLPSSHAPEPIHRIPPVPKNALAGQKQLLSTPTAIRDHLRNQMMQGSPADNPPIQPQEPQISTPETVHPLLAPLAHRAQSSAESTISTPPLTSTGSSSSPTTTSYTPTTPPQPQPQPQSQSQSQLASPSTSPQPQKSQQPSQLQTQQQSSSSPPHPPPPPPQSHPQQSIQQPSPPQQITVETTPHSYILQTYLPGYQLHEITLSTRKKRILHVVADNFGSDGPGHFERRISFGYDADMGRVRAEFNGSILKITVPRRAGVSAPPLYGGSWFGGSGGWSSYNA